MVLSQPVPNIHVIGIAQKLKLQFHSKLMLILMTVYNSVLIEPTIPTVLFGVFNIDLMQVNAEQKALTKHLITDKGYTRLINRYTTDYCTQIDHVSIPIYHNVYNQQVP